MSDAHRWNATFGAMHEEHWWFYTMLWYEGTNNNAYEDFDLMNIGGGPL